MRHKTWIFHHQLTYGSNLADLDDRRACCATTVHGWALQVSSWESVLGKGESMEYGWITYKIKTHLLFHDTSPTTDNHIPSKRCGSSTGEAHVVWNWLSSVFAAKYHCVHSCFVLPYRKKKGGILFLYFLFSHTPSLIVVR